MGFLFKKKRRREYYPFSIDPIDDENHTQRHILSSLLSKIPFGQYRNEEESHQKNFRIPK